MKRTRKAFLVVLGLAMAPLGFLFALGMTVAEAVTYRERTRRREDDDEEPDRYATGPTEVSR